MKTPGDRSWYLAAVILGVAALAAECVAKRQAGLTVVSMARHIAERTLDGGRVVAEHHPHWYTIWNLTGICCLTLMGGCWVVSWRKRERGGSWLLVSITAICLLLGFIQI